MGTRRVVYDALAIGGLWGLVEVVFTFVIGVAPSRDFVEVFLAPVVVALAYHAPLWALSRLRSHRVLDLLLSTGLVLPPVLFCYRSLGWGSTTLLAASLLPILLGFVLVMRQFRNPNERGWLTSPRLCTALPLYVAAAAIFALRTGGRRADMAATALTMAGWFAASALVLVGAVTLARRRAGPAVLAATFACALAVALQRGAVPPSYQRDFREEAPPPPARADVPNVLLIVLDTVRADHLDLYGYSRPTLAQTSRYLREGLVFDRATSSGTFSLTSHGSLFSGLLPSAHGAYPTFSRDGRYGRMREDIPTLAGELRRRGYRTAGVSANSAFLGQWTGLQRGFDSFQVSRAVGRRFRSISTRIRSRLPSRLVGLAPMNTTWTAKEISDAAIAITTQTESPFFLFLNYFDAHGPHQLTGSPPWVAPAGADPISAYDSEIAYIDSEVSRLLRSLGGRGQLDRTLVIFTADHGEYFGEKNLRGHPPASYEGSTHVPLALRLRGVVPRGRSARRTGLHEVFRMTLDVVDQRSLDWLSQIDPAPRILSEAWKKEDYDKAPAAGGRPTATVVFAGTLKLIHRLSGPSELFDLKKDPAEEQNLIDSEDPHVVMARERMVREVMRRPVREPGPTAPLSEDATERLRALGYIK